MRSICYHSSMRPIDTSGPPSRHPHGKVERNTADSEKTSTLQTPAPSLRVLRQFRIITNAIKTHFRQVEKTAGIGGAQLWALGLIDETPGMGMNELSAAMDVHQSTASNLAKTLIGQGLIEARKNEQDKRTVALHLLPAGAQILQAAPGPFTGVLPNALENLDEATLSRLEQDLAQIISVLEADTSAAKKLLADM